jgi:hypothetical protein
MSMNDIDAGKSLALAGSIGKPLRWLLVLIAIPLLGAIAALTVVRAHAGMPKAPFMPLAVVLAPAIILITTMVVIRSLRRAGVSIDQGELVVNIGLGRAKRVRLSSLRARGLQTVDLNERNELKPLIRTWGTSLPGFSAGWFRLRNGEKAVCVLLDRQRVSYLRSEEDNLSLLLSLAEPEKLRALLERHGY